MHWLLWSFDRSKLKRLFSTSTFVRIKYCNAFGLAIWVTHLKNPQQRKKQEQGNGVEAATCGQGKQWSQTQFICENNPAYKTKLLNSYSKMCWTLTRDGHKLLVRSSAQFIRQAISVQPLQLGIHSAAAPGPTSKSQINCSPRQWTTSNQQFTTISNSDFPPPLNAKHCIRARNIVF